MNACLAGVEDKALCENYLMRSMQVSMTDNAVSVLSQVVIARQISNPSIS
jgi:hypothetical protein